MTPSFVPTYLCLKTATAQKLGRNGGGITYKILCDAERQQLYLTLVANEGGGYYSREVFSVAGVEACLPPDRAQAFAAKCLAPAMRGKSYEFADTQMADGKEFIGQAAADVGLVDGIMSYSDLLTKLQESTIDQSQKFMDTRGGNSRGLSGHSGLKQLSGESTMPQTMTEAQIAASAAGAPVAATATAETPVVEATAQDQVDPAASAPTEAQAATGTTEAPATQAVADTSGIALLQANIQLNDLKNQLAAANVDALRQIVAAANDNMRIALGGSALGAVGTPAELVAAHNELKGQFVNKFKAGGVSAATSQVEGKSVAPAFNAREQAQLAAVRNVK